MTLQTALPANTALVPADALPAGTRLEDYEIDCVIARSAIALVYRAQDRTSLQTVAIKEFLPTGLAMRGDDGQVVPRETMHEQTLQHGRQVFLDEAKALESCEHACLMPVLRVLECNRTAYKVMPYCPGPTLLEHRQNMATAPTDRLLRTWIDGLLGALAQLHDKGRVHGAVSPGNILMLADNRPGLLDSDAVYAAILSDRTRSMIAALEPCFAPQEQCEPAPERPVGPWTDLYALAATMRFCVSGQLPGAFAHRSRGAWSESAGRPQADAHEPAGAEVPPWLKSLDACLADAARKRPRSVAQLRRLLAIDTPKSAAAVPSAAAELAPTLSSPVPRSSAGTDRPLHEPATDVQGAAQVVPPAPLSAAQMPLPLDLMGVPTAGGVEQIDANGATGPPESITPADSAPAVSPGPATTAEAKAPGRSRPRLAAVVGSLLVAAIGLATVSLFKDEARPGPGEPKTSGPAQSMARSTAQPASPVLEPAQASARQPAARADASAVASAQVGSETQAPQAAVVNPQQGKPAPPKAPRKPVVAKEQSRPPSAAKMQASGRNPRQACSGKERYALLQCMETQCAKKAWTAHDQCVRLRKERKL